MVCHDELFRAEGFPPQDFFKKGVRDEGSLMKDSVMSVFMVWVIMVNDSTVGDFVVRVVIGVYLVGDSTVVLSVMRVWVIMKASVIRVYVVCYYMMRVPAARKHMRRVPRVTLGQHDEVVTGNTNNKVAPCKAPQ